MISALSGFWHDEQTEELCSAFNGWLSPSVSQEALTYFNVTTKQKEMLEFAQNYLQTDDEVGSSPAKSGRGRGATAATFPFPFHFNNDNEWFLFFL